MCPSTSIGIIGPVMNSDIRTLLKRKIQCWVILSLNTILFLFRIICNFASPICIYIVYMYMCAR